MMLTLPSGGDVKVKFFTPAFRKVREDLFSSVPSGTTPEVLNLVDQGGKPLANGIYYVVVEGPQDRKVLKLLLIH